MNKSKVIINTVLLSIILIISFAYFKFQKPTIENDSKVENKIKNEVSVTIVGDLLFESPFYNAINNGYDQNKYFSLVKDYFQEDDLSIGNMEVVIGNENLKVSGDGYNFCAPSSIGDLVSKVGFEILSTANNHAYDRGIEGIFSTIDYFKNNSDILTVGTYKTAQDRNNLLIKEINNIKFGFLAYTYGTNRKIDSEYKDLISYYKDPYNKLLTSEYKDKVRNEVQNLREKSDVVIVMLHWGNEFTYNVNAEQKEMADFLNSLGVDIIIGNHSHSIQPMEIIEKENHKTLVYYSLGNFVSADQDIARTPKGEETFDNSYQFGLLSSLKIIKENDLVTYKEIKTEPIINYFDQNMTNFLLIPFDKYSSDYEISHYRYSYGLTRDFIKNTYESVISPEFR